MQGNLTPLRMLPTWLPDAVRLYLDHTEDGLSLRALPGRLTLSKRSLTR